jgi:hypothetical protein
LRDIPSLRLPIRIGSESAPGLVAAGGIGERNQHQRPIFEDRADAVPRKEFGRRQPAFVTAHFENGAGLHSGVPVENGRMRQMLGGECAQQQYPSAGKRLGEESRSANHAEKCSTFQVTPR